MVITVLGVSNQTMLLLLCHSYTSLCLPSWLAAYRQKEQISCQMLCNMELHMTVNIYTEGAGGKPLPTKFTPPTSNSPSLYSMHV